MAKLLAAAGTGENLYYFNAMETMPMSETLVDNLSVGVIFTDRTGILTYLNKKAELIFQIDKKTVIGKRIDMLPLKTTIYKAMSENCRDCPVEMNILGRGVIIKSTEVRNSDGWILGEITELRDVTAEKKEKRQREEFVAMMTHDLKSPLMVMLGHVQAMKLGLYGDIDHQFRSSIEEIERSGLNLGSMLENVLDIYRLETGLIRIDRKLTDIGGILESCRRDFMLQAEDGGIELNLDVEESITQVFMDGKQLKRVFANLLGNAIKFTPRGGRVSVEAGMNGEMLHVTVKDTGIGIPEKDISRVFNKYFRSGNASGFKGTGLGLAISKAIVEAHGGIIEVESIQDLGTIFILKIPIHAC
ncbi:MAG TPA: ATP-binding protein [Geobacteraceae bacterium]|nr:ATP-binding protein [Geobacteraceae bacterium]